MSKPLELTVYPRNGFGYQVPLRVWSPISCDPEDDFRVVVSEDNIQERIEAKRFTDAELASEYWAAAEEATSRHFRAMESDEAQRIEGALLRFATIPHHGEVAP